MYFFTVPIAIEFSVLTTYPHGYNQVELITGHIMISFERLMEAGFFHEIELFVLFMHSKYSGSCRFRFFCWIISLEIFFFWERTNLTMLYFKLNWFIITVEIDGELLPGISCPDVYFVHKNKWIIHFSLWLIFVWQGSTVMFTLKTRLVTAFVNKI